jgi:hypothetical protein
MESLPEVAARSRPPSTGRDVEMDQLTAVVTDEEEDVQDPVVNGADDQEIDCPDALNSFERQVLQLWLPARVVFRRRYRRIERLLTTIPNLSSSPRMRSVPQSRFSWVVLTPELHEMFLFAPPACHRSPKTGHRLSLQNRPPEGVR